MSDMERIEKNLLSAGMNKQYFEGIRADCENQSARPRLEATMQMTRKDATKPLSHQIFSGFEPELATETLTNFVRSSLRKTYELQPGDKIKIEVVVL